MVKKDNRITMRQNKVNPFSHRVALSEMQDAMNKGFDFIRLDMRRVKNAYPNGMIPLLATIDYYKRQGMKFKIDLPNDIQVRNLFFNTNWAHLLLPDKISEQKTMHYKHLAARRFRTFQEQQDLVNEFMDIVIGNLELNKDIITALEWSINEITDNVLNHSNSEDGGIVQLSSYPQNHRIAFAVADSGRGIKDSLNESYPDINSDILAIGEAVKSGVTRNNDIGQGNGLAGTLRIAEQTGGSFSVLSGKGRLSYYEGKSNRNSYKDLPYYGTVVSADFVDNSDSFSIESALEFDGVAGGTANIIELNYLSEDSKSFKFTMKDESTGFGNRPVGRMIKHKINNILQTEETIPVIVDWEGIPIISSSFADEFMGKLFLELGPMVFSARIRNIGMEPIIHGLLDKAISQRLTQANDEI
jgi:anti-sigma regulatory factor (Ser/Thr protein kinase)